MRNCKPSCASGCWATNTIKDTACALEEAMITGLVLVLVLGPASVFAWHVMSCK